jgi:hypothetical protein
MNQNGKKIYKIGLKSLFWTRMTKNILDLFDNPVDCLTSLAVFQAKALQNRISPRLCVIKNKAWF